MSDPGKMLDQAEAWLATAAGTLLGAIATAPVDPECAAYMLDAAELCADCAVALAKEVGVWLPG